MANFLFEKKHVFAALSDSIQGILLAKYLQTHFTVGRCAPEIIEEETEEIDYDIDDKIEEEIEFSNICPTCSGTGKILGTKYIRQERVVVPVTFDKICNVCNGSGVFLSRKIKS